MNFSFQGLRPRTWLRLRAFAWMFAVLAVLLFKQANPQSSAQLLASAAQASGDAPLPPEHHAERSLGVAKSVHAARDFGRDPAHPEQAPKVRRPVTMAARLRHVLEVL